MTEQTAPGEPRAMRLADFIHQLARLKRADLAAGIAGITRLMAYRERDQSPAFATAWAIALDTGLSEPTRHLMLAFLEAMYVPGSSIEKPNYLPRVLARLREHLDRETARIEAKKAKAGDDVRDLIEGAQ